MSRNYATLDNGVFGERLYNLLIEKNIKQNFFAEKIGITSSALNQYIGHASFPTVKNLISIAKELNVSPDYLLGFSDSLAANITDEKICEELKINQPTLDGLRNNIENTETTEMIILEKFLSDNTHFLAQLISYLTIMKQCKDSNFFHSLSALQDNTKVAVSIIHANDEYDLIEYKIGKLMSFFINNLEKDNFSFFTIDEIKRLEKATSDKRVYEITKNLSSSLASNALLLIPEHVPGSALHNDLIRRYDEKLHNGRVQALYPYR